MNYLTRIFKISEQCSGRDNFVNNVSKRDLKRELAMFWSEMTAMEFRLNDVLKDCGKLEEKVELLKRRRKRASSTGREWERSKKQR